MLRGEHPTDQLWHADATTTLTDAVAGLDHAADLFLEYSTRSQALFATAFDEVVRWLSPIQSIGRLVIAPTTLAGVGLRPGDEVVLVIGAANRDPAQLIDPEGFDAFRDRKPHLAFGGGIHLCAGTWASRGQIGRVAWPMLHQRLVGLRPVDTRAARWHGFTFRGLRELPVTWQSRHSSRQAGPSRLKQGHGSSSSRSGGRHLPSRHTILQ